MSPTARIRIALVAALVGGCVAAWGPVANAGAAIYWQNSGAEIGRSNLDGSNPEPSFITFPTLPGSQGVTICGGVAVDSEYIYWADNQHSTIGRARLDGSDVRGAFVSGASEPCGIALDSSHVYWVNSSDDSIGRANLDGTGVDQALVDDAGFRPCGLVASASNLFWTNSLDEISRSSLSGTKVVAPLVPGVNACGLATSGSHVYWTDFDGSIGRATFSGTEVNYDLITDLLHPCALTIHAGKIYWTEQPFGGIGSISRAGIDGSGVERSIVPGIRSPCGIAVDDLTVPPKPVPTPGQLSFGPVKHNRRAATTLVRLSASVSGRLKVKVPLGIRYRFMGGGPEVSAGDHWLKLSARRGFANSWPRTGLRRRGKAQFTLRVDYSPTVGAPQAIARKVSLLWARPGRSSRR